MRKKAKYNMSFYQKKYKCDAMIKEVEEVDITSLLDILVILLVFLLKSYNASSLRVDLVNDLSLANSEARDLGQFAPVVQVTGNYDFYVDNKMISNVNNGNFQTIFSNKLAEIRKKEIEKFGEKKHKELKFNNINIVLDQDLPYSTLDRIMNVASTHEYENFKFIVKGNYN